ncbi:MFS transporter [Hahella sp. HN01]|uniref:MFS transporter n=1 Tax=Hahella sp. HN01 TaxID=2847262 RepID=UPI001C1F11E5|nr:MFS transporter [Hahella sp. HN01]MBU6953119.1 MFS transporter [Hahella sp. HN01]
MVNSVEPLAEYRGALAALLLSTFLTALAISSVNILLPALVSSLDASYAQVHWVVVAYLIALSSFLVIAGSLGDTFGRRPLFIAGLGIFMAGSALCGMTENIGMLSMYRGVQGIGAAIVVSLNLALVRDIAPSEHTGRVMGWIGGVSAVGTAAGPVLGGLITGFADWRWVFWLNLPLGAFTLLLVVRYLPRARQGAGQEPKPFDLMGAFLLAIIVLLYSLGIKLKLEEELLRFFLAGLALVLLVIFVLVERAKPSPLLHLSLLRDYRFGLSYLIQFIVALAVMTALVIGPFYLISLGLNLSMTGLVMGCSPVCVMITSSFIGRRVKPEDCSNMASIGVLFLFFGSLCLTQLSAATGAIGYVACLMVTAIGYAIFTVANNTQLMARAAPEQRGQISGLLNLARNLGMLTGAALMSALFDSVTSASALGALTSQLAETGLHRVYACVSLVLCVGLAVRGYWHFREYGEKDGIRTLT